MSEKCVFHFACTCVGFAVENAFLTRDGGVQGKGLQAGQLFSPGLLHTGTEDVLPRVELQQLDATQQLIGFLQPLTGVLLQGQHQSHSHTL